MGKCEGETVGAAIGARGGRGSCEISEVIVYPLYPRPLRLPPPQPCARAVVRLGGKRDRGTGIKLSLSYNRSRSAVTARRGATSRKELVERTGKGLHHPTEALDSRSAFGGDGGKVQGKGTI
jgi:hypothetical protein